jgi:hypothetical protein
MKELMTKSLIRILVLLPFFLMLISVQEGRSEGTESKKLFNLGPIGARGRITTDGEGYATGKYITVKYIFPGTPAAKLLQIDDVIIGVNGKKFSKGKTTASRETCVALRLYGAEIDQSEAGDGKFVLLIKRKDVEKKITFQLKSIGSYASSYPYKCEKTETVLKDSCRWLAKRQQRDGSWACGTNGNIGKAVTTSVCALALLGSEDPAYIPHIRRAANWMVANVKGSALPKANTKSTRDNWALVYAGIFLAEFYMADDNMRIETSETLKKNDRYKYGAKGTPENKKVTKEDHTFKNKLIEINKLLMQRQLPSLGFGHGGVHPENPDKYNELGIMSSQVLVFQGLLRSANIPVNEDKIARIQNALEWMSAKGEVGYKGRPGQVGCGYTSPGRSGCSALAYTLLDDRGSFAKLAGEYVAKEMKKIPNGRSSQVMSVLWSTLGLAAANPRGLRQHMDYHLWYFDTLRHPDGGFVVNPGNESHLTLEVVWPWWGSADYAMGRNWSTGVHALLYTLGHKSLLITGATPKPRVRGLDHENISSINKHIYTLIGRKRFKESIDRLNAQKEKGGLNKVNQEAADLMYEYIDITARARMKRLEGIDRKGDPCLAVKKLKQLDDEFGKMPKIKEEIIDLEDYFSNEYRQKIISVGEKFYRIAGNAKDSPMKAAKLYTTFINTESNRRTVYYHYAVAEYFINMYRISRAAEGKRNLNSLKTAITMVDDFILAHKESKYGAWAYGERDKLMTIKKDLGSADKVAMNKKKALNQRQKKAERVAAAKISPGDALKLSKPLGADVRDKKLFNLGQLGIRGTIIVDDGGWAKGNTITVKHIFENSLSVERMELQDVIIGANGKLFKTLNPLAELGKAIATSEGSKKGEFSLTVNRGENSKVIKFILPLKGNYSKTYPYNCKKSELILNESCDWLLKNQRGDGSWGSVYASSVSGLALMAHGDPKYDEAIDKVAKWMLKRGNGNTKGNWDLAYQGIFLAEYFLNGHFNDYELRRKLKSIYWNLVRNQLPDFTYGHSDLHHDHSGSYTVVNIIGTHSLLYFGLLKKCGIEMDAVHLYKTQDYLEYCSAGGVSYGDGGGGGNATRTGSAVIGFMLLEDRAKLGKHLAGTITNNLRKIPNGHGSQMMSLLWGSLGMAKGDMRSFRRHMDYHRWYFDLVRASDGGFFANPGNESLVMNWGGQDLGLGRSWATGIHALIMALDRKNIAITGKEVTIPLKINYLDPKTLTKNTQKIFDFIERGRFTNAIKKIKELREKALEDDKETPEEMEDERLFVLMGRHLQKVSDNFIHNINLAIKKGDLALAAAKLKDYKKIFDNQEVFMEKVEDIAAKLSTKESKAVIKIGKAYHNAINTITSSPQQALPQLKKLVKQHSTSVYAKWATDQQYYCIVAMIRRGRGDIQLLKKFVDNKDGSRIENARSIGWARNRLQTMDKSKYNLNPSRPYLTIPTSFLKASNSASNSRSSLAC